MTSYHHGYLLVGEENGNFQELFNHARTAAYMQASTALGCGTIMNVLDDGGCEGYSWMPAELDDGPPNGAPEAPNGWWQQTYTTPDDATEPAPWYNASYPESAQALGFWITEWTGLDSGHTKRGVTNLAARGGQLGRTSSVAREMGFEVILLAESEAAMDYLYRWLDATISSVCATCATNTIMLRRICVDIPPGDLDQAATGVVEMRGVGLISGMEWGGPPVEQAGCYIRRVNFTMAAEDPCMYSFCEDIAVSQTATWATCWAGPGISTGRGECRPTCSEMAPECRTTYDVTIDTVGASAPKIILEGPTVGATAVRHRIRVYSNPLGLSPTTICSAALLAELYLVEIPTDHRIIYDLAGRTVKVQGPSNAYPVDGFAFVEPNDAGVPRFTGLGCGDYMVVIEPSDFCYDSTPSTDRQFDSYDVDTQERMGCV